MANKPYGGSGSREYNQLGTDILGHSNGDLFGSAVVMSKDGLRVAIAAPGENSQKGVVRVYQWNAFSEQWDQLGQEICGDAAYDTLGYSMAMNEDGSRIAVGAPESHNNDGCMRVYALDSSTNNSNNSQWQMIGNTINPTGTRHRGRAGESVSMNAAGDRVAFGAPRTNLWNGRVEVFQLNPNNGQWVTLGGCIDSDVYAFSGGSIALSANGNRIVVGGRLDAYYHGTVKVYDYDENESSWLLNGVLTGSYYYDRFGGDVDMSEDGTRIVVGAYTSDGTGQDAYVYNAGEFEVFEYDTNANGNWARLGDPILGNHAMDELGQTVVISGDGTHVAVSSPGSDQHETNGGKIQVYTFNDVNQQWELIEAANLLTGGSANANYGGGGRAIAMDRSGTRIAAGANALSGGKEGIASVFEATHA